MRWHVFLFSGLNCEKAKSILYLNTEYTHLINASTGTYRYQDGKHYELLTLSFLDIYNSDVALALKELFRTIDYEYLML